MVETLVTLLHLLVFVYWLGGDIGSFYSSTILTDPKRSPVQRAIALTILNNVDMAPRSCLILALPTGLTLGFVKGWLGAMPAAAVAGVWAVALVWLGLAWATHLTHGTKPGVKKADMVVRSAAMVACAAMGLGGLMGLVALPLFIAGKLLILAGAIGLGLIIRAVLKPLFAPYAQMMKTGATPQTDAAIAGVLARSRAVVVTLWVLLLAAALLGLATPT